MIQLHLMGHSNEVYQQKGIVLWNKKTEKIFGRNYPA